MLILCYLEMIFYQMKQIVKYFLIIQRYIKDTGRFSV